MASGKITVPAEGESRVELFRKKPIRKTLHSGEWWFSIKDVIESLTEVQDGSHYIAGIRSRDTDLQAWWEQNVAVLPFMSGSGRQQTNFVNIEGIFRIMQSIPTSKSEPFKKWLAKVAFERLQELQNPELAIKRAITLYRAKGYDDEWIDARIRNKASREILTSQWDRKGMAEYIGVLTDAIAVETFGIDTASHKEIKGLSRSQSLRDNMTPIELTLTTLGEQVTSEIIKATNPVDYDQNMTAAARGGNIAGLARKQIESATGQKVVSSKNYLSERQRQNNLKLIPASDMNEILNRLLDVPQKE